MRTVIKNVRTIGLILLSFMLVLFIYITFIQIAKSDFLSQHPSNLRSVFIMRKIPRGKITDRNGKTLVTNKKVASGFKREYLYGEFCAHVIGYDSDKYGKAGIERFYNGHLSGLMNPLRRFGPLQHFVRPTQGNDIRLTINVDLQEYAYNAMENYRGAVVLLSPATGEILALVSKPGYNPNLLDKQWNSIQQHSDSPLVNRSINGIYPPGSIIKVMWAESALQDNLISLNDTFECKGKLHIGDYILHEANNQVHGKVNISQALKVSCNVTFGHIAMELGRSKIEKTFERYGLFRNMNLDLEESSARLPNFKRITDGEVAQIGIGQSGLLVTPLQMAMMTSIFANDGILVKPFLVDEITSTNGELIHKTKPIVLNKPVTAEIAGEVKKMMEAVIDEGTGQAAKVAGVKIAGKTGTAENPHGKPHSWFIGFAPVQNPQYVIAMVLENAGSGGQVAAPIAARILQKALRQGGD